MRILTLALLFLPGLVLAQYNVVQLPNAGAYRGNPYQSQPLILLASDSSASVTAIAYQSRYGQILDPVFQPSVIRQGRTAYLRWESTALLPQLVYVEIRLAGVTRYTSTIAVSKVAPISTSSSPLTVIDPNGSDVVYLGLWNQLMLYLF